MLNSRYLRFIITRPGKFYDLCVSHWVVLAIVSAGLKQLTVYFSILKLSCWNFIIKEQVNLAKGAVLGLGKAEPTPDIAEEIGSGIKESGFCAPVPCYEFDVSNKSELLKRL